MTQVTHIYKDTTEQGIGIKRVNIADGSPVPGYVTILISLADLAALGLTKKEMKVRLDIERDPNTCLLKKRAVLATEWEAY